MDLIMTGIGKVEAVRSCSVSRFVPISVFALGPMVHRRYPGPMLTPDDQLL
jgi:hypothetical protein